MTEILGLLLLLQVKHMLADFCLQTRWMIRHRREYGHPAGLAHVAIHLVGSLVAFWIVGTDLRVLAVLLAAEAVFHYHLDWAKDNLVAARALGPTDALYWYAVGLDQFLHQASYLAMVWWWARSG